VYLGMQSPPPRSVVVPVPASNLSGVIFSTHLPSTKGLFAPLPRKKKFYRVFFFANHQFDIPRTETVRAAVRVPLQRLYEVAIPQGITPPQHMSRPQTALSANRLTDAAKGRLGTGVGSPKLGLMSSNRKNLSSYAGEYLQAVVCVLSSRRRGRAGSTLFQYRHMAARILQMTSVLSSNQCSTLSRTLFPLTPAHPPPKHTLSYRSGSHPRREYDPEPAGANELGGARG